MPKYSTLYNIKTGRLGFAKTIFGALGENTNIEAPMFVTWGCNTFFGEGCYVNRKYAHLFLFPSISPFPCLTFLPKFGGEKKILLT